jgi:hypothetical protein
MIDYKVGDWHGWNGGPCPVHPKTEVEWVSPDAAHGGFAHEIDWGDLRGAFRVVKAYQEPREWWISLEKNRHVGIAYASLASAVSRCDHSGGEKIVHVREVLK